MMGRASDTGPDSPTEWYLLRDGQQHGPLTDRELNELRRLGHLRSSDLLWRNGWSDWAPVATVFGAVPIQPQEQVAKTPSTAGQALVHLLLLAAFVVFPGLMARGDTNVGITPACKLCCAAISPPSRVQFRVMSGHSTDALARPQLFSYAEI